MHKKKLILLIFILVALVQIYVPAKMIFDSETVLESGTVYKFKVAPVDPNDPFRGKYITLSFLENRFQVPNVNAWATNEVVYVILTTDKDGFARIHSLSKEKPADNQHFVKAKIGFATATNDKYLNIVYPFDRFYMEESKAPVAEKVYLEAVRDTTQVAFALVKIYDGEAVLKDVMIDGISIREIVKNRNQNQNP